VTVDCRLSGEANVLIFPNLDFGGAARRQPDRDRGGRGGGAGTDVPHEAKKSKKM
jgi:hypothetical protein